MRRAGPRNGSPQTIGSPLSGGIELSTRPSDTATPALGAWRGAGHYIAHRGHCHLQKKKVKQVASSSLLKKPTLVLAAKVLGCAGRTFGVVG